MTNREPLSESNRYRKADRLSALPPVWPHDLLPSIQRHLASSGRKLVVLDDDPTGTQTVYDIPVLTQWDAETLTQELQTPGHGFYILTNSRSVPLPEALAINREIARNLQTASESTGIPFTVVSRSDSTLRGHFPGEIEVLNERLGPFDGVLLVPFFEEGGRLTLDDVHYVVEEEEWVPAAETPFAQDAVFGFRSSDLREWIAEKLNGAISKEAVGSLSLTDIRQGGPECVAQRLLENRGRYWVVNAVCQRDVETVVLGLFQAEEQGCRFLFRTAASFVAARLGLAPRPLLRPTDWISGGGRGGLTLVGSYVPKTTEQLNRLLNQPDVQGLELDVAGLLSDKRRAILTDALSTLNQGLDQDLHFVVYTSRDLVTGRDAAASLEIGRKISDALVEIVRGLAVRPGYLIGKGGITSSVIATHGLGVRRAMVLGKIIPGVPVWRLGEETKFPGLGYVVFPGNVGGTDSLAGLVAALRENPLH